MTDSSPRPDGRQVTEPGLVDPAARYRASAATPHKQDGLREILVYNTSVVRAIQAKRSYSRPYLWGDLNSGPGRDPVTGAAGSPIIARTVLRGQGISHRAFLYDRDPYAAACCKSALLDWPEATVYHADHAAFIDVARTMRGYGQYGMIYHDPTNAPALAVDVLAQCADMLPRVDILLNVACASYKRCVNHDDYRPLAESLERIGKTHWVVRTPFGKHQWSMIVGTNWDGWKRTYGREFFRVDTDEGAAILDTLSKTKEEAARERQPTLLDV